MIDVIQAVVMKSCKPFKETAGIVLKTCVDKKDLSSYEKADTLFRNVLGISVAEEISSLYEKPIGQTEENTEVCAETRVADSSVETDKVSA